MFWDGRRWIDQRIPPRRPAPTPRRLRDWLATGVMLAAAFGLVLPFIHVSGDNSRITLSPSAGLPGTRVTATVSGLPSQAYVQLTWDGTTAGMPAGSASNKGELRLRFAVPVTTPGSHQVAIMTATPPTRGNPHKPAASLLPAGMVLIAAAFAVGDPNAVPPTPTPTQVASLPSFSPTPTPVATARVTPTPTPSPTTAPPPPTATPVPPPVATPAPPPPATPAPTQPPTAGCPRVANVDASGQTDVTGVLQAFLNASPNNSTVCLVAGGQYRVDGTLVLEGRSGLTLNGQGARIFGTTTSNNPKLRLQVGNDLVVSNLTIESVHPEAGTTSAHILSREHGHGIGVYGALRVTLGPNLTLRNISGDGVYITGGETSSGFRWSDGATITGCRIERNGRMGVALTDGARNVVVSGCVLDQIAMYAFDIEPNGVVMSGALLGADNVRFSDNTIGRYTIDTSWAPLLFTGTGNGPQRNIEFSRNTVTGGPLRIGVWNVAGSLRSDFRILDNRSSSRIAGPAMDFSGVAGLTVTGNTQPLSGGALATTSGCTNVTMTGNLIQ